MNEKKFAPMGDRLRDERLRINLQQNDLADQCDVSRRTFSAWEKGESTPSAEALAVMAGYGADVLYIVTGQRSVEMESNLAPSERELVTAWRNANAKGRTALAAMADALKPE